MGFGGCGVQSLPVAEKTYLFRVPYYGFYIWFLKKEVFSAQSVDFRVWGFGPRALSLGLRAKSTETPLVFVRAWG